MVKQQPPSPRPNSHEKRPFKANQGRSIDRISFGRAKFRKKQQKEKEARLHEKSQTLRNYAKLCKREGIISDRVRIGPNSEESKPRQKKQPVHANSLQKEYASAIERKQHENEQAVAAAADAAELKKLKDKKREQQNQLRMQKTKKGQPVLGNQIKSILSKLQEK